MIPTAGTVRTPADVDADNDGQSLFDQRRNQLRWLRLLPAPRVVSTQYGRVSGAACLSVMRMADEIIGKRRSPRVRIAMLVKLTKLSRSTVIRAIAALKGDAFVLSLIAEGCVDETALREALAECGMPLLSINDQFCERGRAAGELTILWPTLKALIEDGKFHGETSGGSTVTPTSFHGETSLPPSSALNLSAPLPPRENKSHEDGLRKDSSKERLKTGGWRVPITPTMLADPQLLWDLYLFAKRRGWIGEAEIDVARFFGAAVHARVEGEDPGALFTSIIKEKQWKLVADDDLQEGKRLHARLRQKPVFVPLPAMQGPPPDTGLVKWPQARQAPPR